MRGVSLCSVIVRAGAWAAAGTAAPARRARSPSPGRTSEAMVESQCEAQPLARRDERALEGRIDDVAVARAVAEAVPRQGLGSADGEPLLQWQRVPAQPAPGEEPQIDPTGRAHARVATEVEEDAAELVGAVARNRAAHGGGDAGLRAHVRAPAVLELRPQLPARRRVERVVARIECEVAAEGHVVAVVDRWIRAPRLGGPEYRPRIARGARRLAVAAQLQREVKRGLGLHERAARHALARVVVAVVPLEQ